MKTARILATPVYQGPDTIRQSGLMRDLGQYARGQR